MTELKKIKGKKSSCVVNQVMTNSINIAKVRMEETKMTETAMSLERIRSISTEVK